MTLWCTKKLLDVIRPQQLATPNPDADDWYANLLILDRGKCLLLTHANTLFTIFQPDVRASDLRSTRNLVAELIERELLAETLHPDAFGNLRNEPLRIAKTADRSVLGCMNDTAFLWRTPSLVQEAWRGWTSRRSTTACAGTSTAPGTTRGRSTSSWNGPLGRCEPGTQSQPSNGTPQRPSQEPVLVGDHRVASAAKDDPEG